MKSRSTFAALILAIMPFTTGCWVRSVYPFYEDSDVVIDQTLAGAWVGEGELRNCVLAINLSAASRTYTIEVANSENKTAGCKASTETQGEPTAFRGQLVQIGQRRFFDVVNMDHDGLDVLLKVETDKLGLALTPLDSEWMANAMDSNTVKLQGRAEVFGGEFGAGPPPDGRVTLVSTTTDLRDFLRQHADDKGVFSESGRMMFHRK